MPRHYYHQKKAHFEASSHNKLRWVVFGVICSAVVIAIIAVIANSNKNSLENHASQSTHTETSQTQQQNSQTSQTTQNQQPAQTAPPAIYHVYKVVDGDTIYVEKDGTQMKIRMIGVDTPETVSPSKPVQCYGPEASNFAKTTLANKNVGLEADASQGDTDKYGRFLRYVYVDGYNFNLKLLQDGFAREYTYNTAYKYQSDFRSAENSARATGKGLWNPNTCNGGY